MSADRLVLVRHGRTASNADGRWQGHSDVLLDELGRAQAEDAARGLQAAGEEPTRLVCSDLSRAVDTAAPIAAVFGLAAQPDPQLREVFAGTWEGRRKEDIRADEPERIAAWEAGQDLPVGGGERISAAAARGAVSISAHADGIESGTLIVVAHGGLLRGATQILLGLRYGQVPLAVLRNGHWAVLFRGRDGRWRLDAWNLGPSDPGVNGVDDTPAL